MLTHIALTARAVAVWGLLLGQPVLWAWALWGPALTWPAAIAVLVAAGLIGTTGEMACRRN